jgi:hypothetical protein
MPLERLVLHRGKRCGSAESVKSGFVKMTVAGKFTIWAFKGIVL